MRTAHAAHATRGNRNLSPHRIGLGLLVVGVLAVQFVVAFVASRSPADALQMVVGLAVVAAAVAFPRIVLAFALVSTMFAVRVGPEALNLSATDAYCLLATVAALRFVPWGDRRIRLVLGGLAVYLGMLIVSLVANHPLRAVVEWGHRGLLFGGSLLIGVAIVRSGTTRIALRLFMVAMTVLAVAAVSDAVRYGFAPAYVLQLQKNHSGLLLAAAFLVAFIAKPQIAWPPMITRGLSLLFLLGLLATQSRATALGLAAALAVRSLIIGRRGNERTVSIGVLVVAVVLILLTAVSLNANDLSRPADELKFNTINSRTSVYSQALGEIWWSQPLTGAGIRYFRDPDRPRATPHNLFISELAESGVVGLVGLTALLGATIAALRRSRGPLVVLGVTAFVLRLTQGLADIYWVAGPLTVSLILVGMALADDPTEADAIVGTTTGAEDGNTARPSLTPRRSFT